MIQVHLFSDVGKKHTSVVESVQSQANTFFREQGISEEELVHCELSLAAGDEWTEMVMMVVVDIEPEITEEQMDAALHAAFDPIVEDAKRAGEQWRDEVEQALQPWKETII